MAQKAIQLAEAGARENGIQDRTAHVGFYLIDQGRWSLDDPLARHLPEGTALPRQGDQQRTEAQRAQLTQFQRESSAELRGLAYRGSPSRSRAHCSATRR